MTEVTHLHEEADGLLVWAEALESDVSHAVLLSQLPHPPDFLISHLDVVNVRVTDFCGQVGDLAQETQATNSQDVATRLVRATARLQNAQTHIRAYKRDRQVLEEGEALPPSLVQAARLFFDAFALCRYVAMQLEATLAAGD